MTGTTFVINNQTNYFPLKNPWQGTQGSGFGRDAFVTKFNPEGSDLVYSTFLGGSANEDGTAIAVDPAGNAVVVGITQSTDFPTANPSKGILEPYPTSPPTYYKDAFVTKFNQSGQALFSTYLGGKKDENAQGVAVDKDGKIYVTGNTYSADFPVTDNAYQPTKQGNCDIFVARIFDVLLNRPPIAQAGQNLTISSEELNTTTIQGAATDPDRNSLTYQWWEGSEPLSQSQTVGADGAAPLSLNNLNLAVGQHTLTLKVSDAQATAESSMILTIGNSAPHANPSGGGTYEFGGTVVLGGYVSDFDRDTLTYSWKEGDNILTEGSLATSFGGYQVSLPSYEISGLGLGNHTLTLLIDDGVNPPVATDVVVEIKDTQRPTLAPTVTPGILWPPNHKMVDVSINTNVRDNSGSATLSATVLSNEPIEGLGDGDAAPDWIEPIIDQASGTISLQLRAERAGNGNGRTYTIAIIARDDSGNTSTSNVNVIVPHDKNPK